MDKIITPIDKPQNRLRNIINYDEYYLLKQNKVFKFIITNLKNKIIIKYKKYQVLFNHKDLSIIIKQQLNTIDEAYLFIISLFEQNKIIIDAITNEELNLLINNNNFGKREFQFTLTFNDENNDLFVNEINNNYNEIINYINLFQDEIKKLKEEIEQLKQKVLNNNKLMPDQLPNIFNNKTITNPKNIEFLKNLSTTESFSNFPLDNAFSVFKSIDNILYLIYSNEKKSIITYDIITNTEIEEISNAHQEYITNFRHYLDSINNKDLIMSISAEDNILKIWNLNKFKLLEKVCIICNKYGLLYSACFLNDNEHIYFVSCNYNYFGNSDYSDSIKVFDINKNKIKRINDSCDKALFIDTYYDTENSSIYIITGNNCYVKSYNYNLNKIYHKYYDKDDSDHLCVVINYKENIVKLIESSENGFIRIWDFHIGELIYKMQINNNKLYSICLWDCEYAFVGCEDKSIKLINLNKYECIKSLDNQDNEVICIKKIIHPQYGECLLSQNANNSKIKLWVNNN